MRNILKIVSFTISLLVLSACEGNKTIDQVFDTIERGAVFRALNLESTSFNAFDDTSAFIITAEVEDHENGDLLDNVNVYIAFSDNTVEEGATNYSADEQLYTTLEQSAFTMGENGFPTITFSISLQEISSSLGVDPANYTGGDNFVIRFELNLTDGRRFSSDNVGATVAGGSFFRSPFQYTANVNCVPLAPVSGDYTIEYADSFGDGWNGAFITVTIDGVSTDYTLGVITEPPFDVTEGSDMFTVPADAQSLIITYTGGNFEGENSYTIYGPNGEVAASDGPGPIAGEVVLNICP